MEELMSINRVIFVLIPLVLFLISCSSQMAVTGEVAGSGAPAPTRTPQVFLGTWEGTLTETVEGKTQDYGVVITLTSAAINERAGTSSYSKIECGGDLYL